MNQPEAAPVMGPAFPGKDAVPVVFSSSAAFVPVCAAVIRSLAKFSDPRRWYDLVILHRGIGEEGQSLILRTVKDFPNVSVRFYDTAGITDRYRLRPIGQIGVETYYRFLIPQIITGFDKVLYLDCDIICLKDVGALYDTELGDAWIGAVRDADMQGQAALDRGIRFYLRDRLKMRDPSLYFQAGVLLLNTAALKSVRTTHEWLTIASEEYLYGDQDILNRYCQGHVKYLDMSWNVLADCRSYRVPVLIEQGPESNREAYRAAREDPGIIHYAGGEKPWNKEDCDLAAPFWEIARETPACEALREILAGNIASGSGKAEAPKKERRAVRFVKRICPFFLYSFAKKVKRKLHL